jgi:isochorismate hydrolase
MPLLPLQGQSVRGMYVCITLLQAHVCIEQTVIDFLNEDISVHVLADGVSSRSLMDRSLALQVLRHHIFLH